jgi:hypothetical protein
MKETMGMLPLYLSTRGLKYAEKHITKLNLQE